MIRSLKKIAFKLLTPEMVYTLNTNIFRLIRPEVRNRALRGVEPVQSWSFENGHVFFGYHDISPYSADDQKILAGVTYIPNRKIEDGDLLRVGYFDRKNGDFREVGVSRSWNWQQGCRLQWLDPVSEKLIYNDFIEGHSQAVVFDCASGKEVKRYPMPVYDLSPNRLAAYSVNFARIFSCRREYGYLNPADKLEDDFDGLFCMDMETGAVKLILSYRDLERWYGRSLGSGVVYMNHVKCSPNGRRVVFFCITEERTGRQIKVFTCDADGGNLYLLRDKVVTSHFSWIDDRRILCYGDQPEGKKGYFIQEDKSQLITSISDSALRLDGHPWSMSEDEFISDTKPNKTGVQQLFRYRISSKEITLIYGQQVPASFLGETRCDFHPRISSTGRYIAIDGLVNGRRGILEFHKDERWL